MTSRDNKKLQLSKYLRIVPRPKDYALYHSLYGALSLADKNTVKFLRNFKKPKTLTEALDRYRGYSSEDIKSVKSLIRAFQKRDYLVLSDTDERNAVNEEIKYRSDHLEDGYVFSVVQLVVTNTCNFRCKYCFTRTEYASKERKCLKKDISNSFMTIDTARKAMDETINLAKKTGKDNISIQFFGGEPLLNWKLLRWVLDHYKKGRKFGIDISYTIVTNGSLVTDEIAKFLKRHNVTVLLSFDAPRSKARAMVNGGDSYKAICRCLAIFKRHGNKVVFNSALADDTFKYFDTDLVDCAKKYGIGEIGLLFDFGLDFYRKHGTTKIVNKVWKVYQYAKKKSICLSGPWRGIFEQMSYEEFPTNQGFTTCSGLGAQFSIEPSGDVFSCKACSAHMGHIDDLEKVLSSKAYRKYAMRVKPSQQCVGCDIEGFCDGVCAGSLEKEYGDINVRIEGACEAYKKLTRKLISELDPNEVDCFSLGIF